MKSTVVASGLMATLSVQWRSASLIELIWTLTGLVGIYLTSGNLKDARKYITAIRVVHRTVQVVTNEARIIAFGHYRNEVLRLCMFLVITGVGIIAMMTPPAISNQKITPVAIAITLGLFTITGLLVMASFFDRRQRDLLLMDVPTPPISIKT